MREREGKEPKTANREAPMRGSVILSILVCYQLFLSCHLQGPKWSEQVETQRHGDQAVPNVPPSALEPKPRFLSFLFPLSLSIPPLPRAPVSGASQAPSDTRIRLQGNTTDSLSAPSWEGTHRASGVDHKSRPLTRTSLSCEFPGDSTSRKCFQFSFDASVRPSLLGKNKTQSLWSSSPLKPTQTASLWRRKPGWPQEFPGPPRHRNGGSRWLSSSPVGVTESLARTSAELSVRAGLGQVTESNTPYSVLRGETWVSFMEFRKRDAEKSEFLPERRAHTRVPSAWQTE